MASGAVCNDECEALAISDVLLIGVWSPLASITLVRTVSFSIYQKSKYTLNDWITRFTGTSPLVVANTKGAVPTFGTIACFGLSGATAGAAITFIACEAAEIQARGII
jgi:hypothetical protein